PGSGTGPRRYGEGHVPYPRAFHGLGFSRGVLLEKVQRLSNRGGRCTMSTEISSISPTPRVREGRPRLTPREDSPKNSPSHLRARIAGQTRIDRPTKSASRMSTARQAPRGARPTKSANTAPELGAGILVPGSRGEEASRSGNRSG